MKMPEIFSLSNFFKKEGSEILALDNYITNIIFFDPETLDEIFKGNSEDMKIYKRMALDDTIENSFEIVNQSLLSLEWSLNTKNETERKFLLQNINNLKYITFENVIENLQDARLYGIVLAEKVKQTTEGKTFIKAIKFKPSRNITSFKIDKYGNLETINYNNDPYSGKQLDNFVMYIYPYLKNGNYYGNSELKSVYREWRSKNILINLMNKALEKQGDPAKLVFWDKNKFKGEAETDIKNFANDKKKNLVIDSSKEIGTENIYESVKTVLVEPSMKNIEMFLKAIEYYSTAIKRKMGIPDDAGYTDTKYGSRSRAEEQLSLMYNNIVTKAKRTEAVLNSQVFKPLIIENFEGNDNREDWNIFKFNTSKEKITKDKAEVLGIMIDKKIIELKTLNKEGWDFLAKFTGFDIIRNRIKDFKEEEKNKTTEIIEQPETKENIVTDIQKILNDTELSQTIKDNLLFQKLQSVVNYGRIENMLDIVEDDATARLQAQVNGIEEDYKKRLLPYYDKRNVNIGKIKLIINGDTKGRIKKIWNETLTKSYLTGKGEGQSELKKKGMKYEFIDKPDNLRSIYIADKTAIGLQEWIKNWQLRTGIKLKAKDKKMLEIIKQKAFTIAGTFTTDIQSKVEKIIIGNIDRLSVGQIFKEIQKEVFDPLRQTPSRNGLESSAWQLRTNIRTNMSTYFNNARMNEFTDPEIADFIQAFEYSAILDSSTTPFCEGHNGEYMKANDPRLAYITPPNHFNDLVKGTLIKTKKGNKKIEDIKIGDIVLSHKGNWCKVYDTMSHSVEKEIYEIELENGKIIEISEEHPLLIGNNKWKIPADIKIGMHLISPEIRPTIICKICGKKFQIIKSQYKYRKTCSQKCHNELLKTHIYCKYCGKELLTKGKKKNKVFCNQKCMGEYYRKYNDRYCLQCGKQILASYKDKYAVSKDRKFCSQVCYFKYTGRTSIEIKMSEMLDRLKVNYEEQKKIGKYIVDFFIPHRNLIIEADGNYWHTTKSGVKEKDEKKDNILIDMGYKILRIGQDTILNIQLEKELRKYLCL